MNDEQAVTFIKSVVDRRIVNVVQSEGFNERLMTTVIFDDGSELTFATDSIRQASSPTPDARDQDALTDAACDETLARGAETLDNEPCFCRDPWWRHLPSRHTGPFGTPRPGGAA